MLKYTSKNLRNDEIRKRQILKIKNLFNTVKKHRVLKGTKKKVKIQRIKPRRGRFFGLKKGPQKAAFLVKFNDRTRPRKPNSAKRKVWRIKFSPKHPFYIGIEPWHFSYAYLAGSTLVWENGEKVFKNSNTKSANTSQKLRPKNQVLIRAGPTKDLPGLKYKIIHGASVKGKVTLLPLDYYKHKRSKYGIKKTEPNKKRLFFKYKDTRYFC